MTDFDSDSELALAIEQEEKYRAFQYIMEELVRIDDHIKRIEEDVESIREDQKRFREDNKRFIEEIKHSIKESDRVIEESKHVIEERESLEERAELSRIESREDKDDIFKRIYLLFKLIGELFENKDFTNSKTENESKRNCFENIFHSGRKAKAGVLHSKKQESFDNGINPIVEENLHVFKR